MLRNISPKIILFTPFYKLRSVVVYDSVSSDPR